MYLGRLDVVVLDVSDEPGPDSARGYVERNSIALLSNFQRSPVDPPSSSWLGRYSDRPLVVGSGLWNQRHTADDYDPEFPTTLSRMIEEVRR